MFGYVFFVAVLAQIGALIYQASGCEKIVQEATWVAIGALLIAAVGGLNILCALHCCAKSITPSSVHTSLMRCLLVGGLFALTLHVADECSLSILPGLVTAGVAVTPLLFLCAGGEREERSDNFGFATSQT